MALRIRVNDELGELERGLNAAEQLLAPGGRLAAVIGGSEPGILGRAHLFVRSSNTFSGRPLFDAGTRALPDFAREESFVF